MIDNNFSNTKGYNLYNFEHDFKSYISAGNQNKDTLKNYLSDFRHFCGFVMRQTINTPIETLITPQLLDSYKHFLIDSGLPRLTINRRLSTVRKFCSFCISQGWLKENPAKHITNVSSLSTKSGPRRTNAHEPDIANSPPVIASEAKQFNSSDNSKETNKKLLDMVFEYENSLGNKKLKKEAVKQEMANINEFLSVINLSH
jgi:hypothetical protein